MYGNCRATAFKNDLKWAFIASHIKKYAKNYKFRS